MKKRLLLGVAIVAIVGLMAGFAGTAQAFPTQTSPCSGCHSTNAAVVVTAVQTANNGTSATYSITVANPFGMNGWGVFNGSSKLAGAATSSGTFTVADGGTYRVFGVSGDGNGTQGYSVITISPVAPAPVDTTAPVTTSDAVATYVSSAAIKLAATDVGSGVASTYYVVDGGTQTAGTSINVTAPGAHTITFWSVDVAGNVETRKTASFTITAPVPVDTTAPITTSDAKATYVSSAAIKLTATDAGSGVASTYYVVDGGTQTAGTSINVTALGAHTITFWSVDVAGNVETHKTASFTITAPVPIPVGVYTVTAHVYFGEHSYGRTATLTNTVTGAQYTATIGRNGLVTFTNVAEGTYTLTAGSNSRTISTIRVPQSQHDHSDTQDQGGHVSED